MYPVDMRDWPGSYPRIAKMVNNGTKLCEITVPYANCPTDGYPSVSIRPTNGDGQGPQHSSLLLDKLSRF